MHLALPPGAATLAPVVEFVQTTSAYLADLHQVATRVLRAAGGLLLTETRCHRVTFRESSESNALSSTMLPK